MHKVGLTLGRAGGRQEREELATNVTHSGGVTPVCSVMMP